MVRFNSKRVNTIFCEFHSDTSNTTFKNQVENLERTQTTFFTSKTKSPSIRFCGNVSGKLCKYLYSDHPDAPQVGEMLTGKNLKEPTSCEDLKLIGHYLKGFYFVWLSSKKVRIVYCDFSNESKDENKNRITQSISNSTHQEPPLYCNGLGSQSWVCYYSNSQNILQFELGNESTMKSQ